LRSQGELLDGIRVDAELKRRLLDDFRAVPLSELNRLMLELAEKITEQPDLIDRDYIDTLKKRGFDDRILHDVVQVAAYFAYVNRVAHALGVELEG
jgi:uncharacterized peroxidase-related enzyme